MDIGMLLWLLAVGIDGIFGEKEVEERSLEDGPGPLKRRMLKQE
jgi:hypothetical protein